MAKATLLFIGTSDGVILFSDPGGIGRWLRVGHEVRGHSVNAVWAQPGNPLVVLAATRDAGLWRSSDGGASWSPAREAHALALAGPRDQPAVVVLGGQAGQVLRSSDGGASWDVWARLGQTDVRHLVVARGAPQHVYAATADGTTWRIDADSSVTPYVAPLAAPIEALSDSPQHPGRLYALIDGTLHTSDGRSWQSIGAAAASTALAVLAGRDEIVLRGSASGIERSDDSGATWSATAAEPAWAGTLTTIAPASYHIDTAFAGTGAGHLAISTDRGRSWVRINRELPAIHSISAARLA